MISTHAKPTHSPLHAAADVVPVVSVVEPAGQGVQSGLGVVALPPAEYCPA